MPNTRHKKYTKQDEGNDFLISRVRKVYKNTAKTTIYSVCGYKKYTKTKRKQRFFDFWIQKPLKNKTKTTTFWFVGTKNIEKQNENNDFCIFSHKNH